MNRVGVVAGFEKRKKKKRVYTLLLIGLFQAFSIVSSLVDTSGPAAPHVNKYSIQTATSQEAAWPSGKLRVALKFFLDAQ